MADQTTQNWFQKNQVFLSGLAGALTLVLQQFINTAEINYKAVGLAVLLATASYIGNQWRGKGVTVLGFLGVAATAFATIQSTGHFTWAQFGLSVLVGFLAMVAPPPKSIEYENSTPIAEAKAEAKAMVEAKKEEDNKPDSKPPTIKYT
jgi:hypothetical protein